MFTLNYVNTALNQSGFRIHKCSIIKCDVTRCIICTSNKVECVGKEHSYKKFYKRSYIVNLSDLPNAIRKIPDKILFHGHFEN